MAGKQKKRDSEFKSKALLFTAKFFAIFLVLYLLLFVIDFSFLEHWLAALEAGFLGLSFSGNSIFLENAVFNITESCIGLFSGIVLAAIIFACRKPGFKAKLAMAFAGSLVLFLLNIPRVFFVLWFGVNFGIEAADWFHVISWFSTTLFIIAVWYLLAKRIVGKEFKDLI